MNEGDESICESVENDMSLQKQKVQQNRDEIQWLCIANHQPTSDGKKNQFKHGFKNKLMKDYKLTKYATKHMCDVFHKTGNIDDYLEEELSSGRPKLYEDEDNCNAIKVIGQLYADRFRHIKPFELNLCLQLVGIEMSQQTTRNILNKEVHAKLVTVKMERGVRTPKAPKFTSEYLFDGEPLRPVYHPEEGDLLEKGNKILLWKGLTAPTASAHRTYKLRDCGDRVLFAAHGWCDPKLAYFPKVVGCDVFCKCDVCVREKEILNDVKKRSLDRYNDYCCDCEDGMNMSENVTNEDVTNYEIIMAKRRRKNNGSDFSVDSNEELSLGKNVSESESGSECESVGCSDGEYDHDDNVFEDDEIADETTSTISSISSGDEEWSDT
jgi:hypothetical protein